MAFLHILEILGDIGLLYNGIEHTTNATKLNE